MLIFIDTTPARTGILLASGLITLPSDPKSGEIWQTAHLPTTAAYCSAAPSAPYMGMRLVRF